ncbi:MAG: DoxX family protein [Ectothiorhodospiraceae bacterium]|nr:DoxX family protein [Ectothiorhodospiraceae bacterium]
MSFLLLMALLAGFSWLSCRLLAWREGLRTHMRIGAAGAFLFTGVDHFLNAEERYVPMMPAFFEPFSLQLVWLTGAAELAGAAGLLLPLAVSRKLGLPDLRYWAGVGLAVMLAVVVIANINVAIQGTGVAGIGLGSWYFWLRPFFQPLIILWVLYAAGVIGRQRNMIAFERVQE